MLVHEPDVGEVGRRRPFAAPATQLKPFLVVERSAHVAKMVALRLRSAGEVGRSAIDIAGASLLNIKRRNHISPCEMCSSGRAPAHQRGLRANSRLASTAATSTSTTGHETEGKEADSRGPAPLVRLESVRLAYPSVHIPSSATCSDIIQPRSSSPISLSVYPPNAEGLGGGHAVLGRNGSGKSLLQLALAHGTSVSGPEHSHLESGTMDMFPDDPNAKTFKSRYPISSVSFDSHHRLLQAGGTGYAALTPLGGRLSKAAEFLVVRFGLFPLLGRDVSTLSTGEIRKVLLVRALATRPSLLLLDNAFDGLDVPSRQSLSDLVSKMLRGFKTDILVQGVSATNAARTQVIMSTHRSEEIVEEIGVISYLGREDSKTGNGIVTEHRAGRSGDVIMRAIHRHESSESSIGDDEEAERDVASSLWNATRQGGSKGASLSSSRDQGFVDRKSWGSAVSGAWNDPEMPSLNAIRSLFQQGREGASASSADPPVRAEQLRVVKDEHTILNNLTWTVAQGDRWLIAGGNGGEYCCRFNWLELSLLAISPSFFPRLYLSLSLSLSLSQPANRP